VTAYTSSGSVERIERSRMSTASCISRPWALAVDQRQRSARVRISGSTASASALTTFHTCSERPSHVCQFLARLIASVDFDREAPDVAGPAGPRISWTELLCAAECRLGCVLWRAPQREATNTRRASVSGIPGKRGWAAVSTFAGLANHARRNGTAKYRARGRA
jgi:hypothetical protein